MPFYRCKVYNQLGKQIVTYKEATDETSLKANLKTDCLILINASVVKEKEPNVFFSVSSKIKRSEVIMFLRQFSVLISSSVSIADALSSLKSQRYSKPFMKVLMEIYRDVMSGKLLSEAFGVHPKVFPRFFVEMVAIGEVSGSLDNVLKQMADYYEKDNKIKGKAKAALTYPSILFVMINIVIIFMSFVILPQFENMFIEFGGTVPKFTTTILDIAYYIRTNLFYIIVGLLTFFSLLYLYFQTKSGKYSKDKIALHLPFVGRINRAIITSRFTKAFVILLNSGMNISDCMENLKRVLTNQVFSKKFDYAITEVKRGKSIARSIENTDMFPSILIEMIKVGEKSGNLEEVLNSTSGFYDDEVERSISKATAALEPIMILFLGAVVVVVLLSVYIPMLDLMNQI